STIVGSLWDTFKKYSSYPTDSDGELTREAYRDLMEDVVDALNISRDDFKELSELLGKLLIQSDYPMWIEVDSGDNFVRLLEPGEVDTANTNHRNLGIGNMVKGLHSILVATSDIVKNEEAKNALHGIIGDLGKIFDPTDPDNAGVFKDLICNLEDHFTEGGSVYESDSRYSTNSGAIYSDAELGATLREFLPGFLQLVARSDRPHSIIDTGSDALQYPMDLFVKNLKAIGFDPDTAHIEESIYDLMRVDMWGRDRRTTTGDWPVDGSSPVWPNSFLESVLFLTVLSTNSGWLDGGSDAGENEIKAWKFHANYSHGHGNQVGYLTLNDGLFSIKTHKTAGLLGLYDIALQDSDGERLFRSMKTFSTSQRDNYRFYYNQNYGMMNCMTGTSAGIIGSPTGGNPDGDSVENNEYRLYNPLGRDEGHLTAWTLGWVTNICMNGEGPYYYKDPSAEVVQVNGKSYSKYLRPSGKVYALVSETGDYLYPTDTGDAEDADDANSEIGFYNGLKQRFNRFKSQWNSDYYMGYYINLFSNKYRTFENTSGSGNITMVELDSDTGEAGCLTYTELIDENEAMRACASPEEAFYRNYQWFMTEKKMVIIIPMHIEAGLGDGIVFQVFEANGLAGLGGLRKFNGNHVWAKTGSDGLSTIPGDYRVELLVKTSGTISGLVNEDSVYDDTLDCGQGTPSLVSHNLPAMYRLGFPRCPDVDRGNGVIDRIVGSKEFAVGDAKWNNRNAVMPIMMALVAGLHNYTGSGTLNAGIKSFADGLIPLLKPLVYYQKGSGNYPQNGWKMNVAGTNPSSGDHQGDPGMMSAAEIYNGTGVTLQWYGSLEEMRHYQPAELKTPVTVLIDSDTYGADLSKRCDGV
ncbi:MAG: hypothetical protein GY765_41730, partial [bacterium]|nr:hypothetical protein [bacterium]